MHPAIHSVRKTREFLLRQVEGLSTEQLNRIPPGFSNNIIWNLAHLAAAQQTLCYFRSGLPFRLPDALVLPYKPGTRPEHAVGEAGIAEIKRQLTDSLDLLQEDYDQGRFVRYEPSENVERVYGVRLENIDDALQFLLYHEGMHSGYIAALKRLVA